MSPRLFGGGAREGEPPAGDGAPDRPSVRPTLVAIAGDSGSGKSVVASAVAALLGRERVTAIRLDDYHRYSREERKARELTSLNPLAHNLPLMQEHLALLREGRAIRNRSYEHADGNFGPIRAIEPREIVITRGILGFPTDALRELYDLAVFLLPEPELLHRWKLRRDTQTRGYAEAEVLRTIAEHLLDAKEHVEPQAERADIVVHYELPTPDAPDESIRTRFVLRRRAAEVARAAKPVAGLADGARQMDDGSEVRIELTEGLTGEAVDGWARGAFPNSYRSGEIGTYRDDRGRKHIRAPLTAVEVLIACLATLLRGDREA